MQYELSVSGAAEIYVAVNLNTDLHTGTWSSAADEGEQRMRFHQSSPLSGFLSQSDFH